ncbi:MAG TPA: hypothetical protein VIY56_06865 [Vicinamibacterales bacterium]
MQWQLTPVGQWIASGIAACLVTACVATALLLWLHGRRAERLAARVAQLSAALVLLTDTVEAGLQDLLRQGVRALPEARTAVTPRVNTRRRVRTAAKRGRTVDQIAATEHLSEGEVRLMLQVAGADVGEEELRFLAEALAESSQDAHHAEMR